MKAAFTITDNDGNVETLEQVADVCKVRTDTSFLVFLVMWCVCFHSGSSVGVQYLTDIGACFSSGLNSLEEVFSISSTTCRSSSALQRKWC